MTDIIQYEGIENLGTTTDLINGKPVYDLDRIIETSGFATSGDGGSGKWKQNGITGQTPSQTPAQLGDALLNDANGNQWTLIADVVDVSALGAVSGVLADDVVQCAINSGLVLMIREGFDLVVTPLGVIAWSSQTRYIIYGTVNGSADATGINDGFREIHNKERGRQVFRNVPFQVNGYIDEKSARAGDTLRLDAKMQEGGSSFYIGSNDRKPVVAGEDYAQFHSVVHNTAGVPRVWGINPVIVKSTDSATASKPTTCFGMEVSVSNNTNEVGPPLSDNQLSGVFCSYINTVNQASAAFECGGLSNGWNYGLYIDGITSGGYGIRMADDVSPNAGMYAGLDVVSVSQFSAAAIRLGNAHKITGRLSAGGLGSDRSITRINDVDELEIGDSTSPLPTRLYTSNLKLNGAGITGGGQTVSSTSDAVLFVNINGTQYKINLEEV
ncbi:MAG: hypothetical protein GY918_10040 [Gammaproteobacteria bacterium]|nr:hypothetical protein [Gammaproteobacteria bacterium]